MSQSILFLGSQMAVGGAQRVLLTQARWFHQQGYRVTVAFFYDKEQLHEKWAAEYPFRILDVRIKKGAAGLLQTGGSLISFYAFLRREQFDIVETFTPHSNLLGLPLAMLAGVPVRVASHHGVIENFPHWMGRLHGWMVNSRITSSLVAVSSRVYQHTTQNEGVKQANLELIPNGVFIPEGEEWDDHALRSELDVDDENHLIISVGRITSQKGHAYLVDAIPEIVKRHPKAVFVFVGEGPLQDDLAVKAHKLGIEHAARFLGTRDDVYALLSIADVFVLPSISEGMPMALLEAMGMGTAVVATNLEGIADVVVDGQHGLLVPPAEVKSLSVSILRLLDDADLRENISKNGRKLVLERYTVDRMCEAYQRLFLGMFAQEPSR
jgi:glycosyltransferase involved in cell wall biosynthesis